MECIDAMTDRKLHYYVVFYSMYIIDEHTFVYEIFISFSDYISSYHLL